VVQRVALSILHNLLAARFTIRRPQYRCLSRMDRELVPRRLVRSRLASVLLRDSANAQPSGWSCGRSSSGNTRTPGIFVFNIPSHLVSCAYISDNSRDSEAIPHNWGVRGAEGWTTAPLTTSSPSRSATRSRAAGSCCGGSSRSTRRTMRASS
jgi:hypothetical protein